MAKKHMTSAEKSKREKIVKGMKKGNGEEFEKRYPGRGKKVMYATATKQAMREDVVAYYKNILLTEIGFPSGNRLPRELGDHHQNPSSFFKHPQDSIGADPFADPNPPQRESEPLDPTHDPKNTGLDISKIMQDPKVAMVSGGDIIDHDDIIQGHLETLSYYEQNPPGPNSAPVDQIASERAHDRLTRNYGFTPEQIEEMMTYERERRRVDDEEHEKLMSGNLTPEERETWHTRRLARIRDHHLTIKGLMEKFKKGK